MAGYLIKQLKPWGELSFPEIRLRLLKIFIKKRANNRNPWPLKTERKSFADFALISPLNFIKK